MLKHSKLAYRTYFALYLSAVVISLTVLLVTNPPEQSLILVSFALAGLASWTAIEYVMHRIILHELPFFSRWHMAHHQHPSILIRGTKVLSTIFIILLALLPALLLADIQHAFALSLGLITGYLGYALTHQAIHHCNTDHAWLKERQRWHVDCHHHSEQPICYGVTTEFWDRIFGSTPQVVAPTNY
ncbi:sterol desaturase family protein [Sulfuriferula nivalis]|uniref:Fatty acid hydroxylase n=1 Tax=Sulfuriferula nivalis TaxID=2675298 RepID=A0A809RIK2_9PROT|nr:sterol desaturase family protein [Sulfuriferula nivalis]BBP01335.1 fatty acid hydroxylase [Sulfuriferula nivalis]